MTLVWRPGILYDADALAYMELVKAADAAAGQTGGLEQGVVDAINDFVVGCKNDGIWDAIKASCILAGARTLDGALVPLVGTAPTNFNFASGDYDRKTGLIGNGTTKYINSNRLDSADPQNNNHLSVYISAQSTVLSSFYIGAHKTTSPASYSIIQRNTPGTMSAVSRSLIGDLTSFGSTSATGFYGTSRAASDKYSYKGPGVAVIDKATTSSGGTAGINYFVFARNREDTGLSDLANGRLAFYSIGESLDLAALDTRVSALITAFQAPGVIP